MFGKSCVLFALFLLVVALQGLALEITDYKVTFTDLQLDKVTARIEVNLKGEGADFVIAKIGGKKFRGDVENGKADITSSIERIPGQDSFTIEVTAFGRYEEVLAQKSFTEKIPIVSIGATLPDVKNDISLTLLWWKESNIALERWGENEIYTISSKPGMKFVILAYEFQNNGRRPKETPYFDKGEIATSQGYIYPLTSLGYRDYLEEHSPRKPTSRELSEFIGDSGGYKKLQHGKKVMGRVLFEIPSNEKPSEIKIYNLFPIISLDKVQAAPKDLVKGEMQSFLESLSTRYPALGPDELLSLFEEALRKRWPSWEK